MFLGQGVGVKESPSPLLIDIQYGDELVTLHCSTLPFITSVVHNISRCNLCAGVVDRPCGSTNRMKAHMKSKHPKKPISSTLHGQPAQSHAVTSNGKQIIYLSPPVLMHAGLIMYICVSVCLTLRGCTPKAIPNWFYVSHPCLDQKQTRRKKYVQSCLFISAKWYSGKELFFYFQNEATWLFLFFILPKRPKPTLQWAGNIESIWNGLKLLTNVRTVIV